MNEQLAETEVLYQFDINHRVYEEDANGRAKGGPIYREHFRPYYVVGKEKRSLLVSSTPDGRYSKKMLRANLLTAEQVDEQCWLYGHRYKICSLLNTCQDASKIKAVADILGYTP